jgi:hypothetical protein
MKDVMKKLAAHAAKPASKAHKGLKKGGMPMESMMEKKMGKGMTKVMMQKKSGRGR